jgi:hypothetical protein
MKDFAVAFLAAAFLLVLVIWCLHVFYVLYWR